MLSLIVSHIKNIALFYGDRYLLENCELIY